MDIVKKPYSSLFLKLAIMSVLPEVVTTSQNYERACDISSSFVVVKQAMESSIDGNPVRNKLSFFYFFRTPFCTSSLLHENLTIKK